jgi:phosphoribosyl 1,2-cyclic phosphodiesterase
MTAGTADALKLKRHNLHIIKADEKFTVCGHKILPVKVKHDAAEPVNFTIDDEILFVTDTGEVPYVSGNFKKVYIEANYDLPTLLDANISESQKQRVRENHLSITKTIRFLRTLTEPDEICLIHLSKRHGNGKEFVERVKSATGFTNVFTAEGLK